MCSPAAKKFAGSSFWTAKLGRLFHVLLAGLLCGETTLGAPAVRTPYAVSGLEMKDSLPLEKIRALVQTRDGYLWLAAASGLGRFDGLNYQAFGKSDLLQAHAINCLLQDRQGTLWLGSDTGEIFVRGTTNFLPVALPAPWSRDPVAAMVEDRNRTIWVRNRAGNLMSIRDLHPNLVTNGSAMTAGQTQVSTDWLFADAQGIAWAVNGPVLHALTDASAHPDITIPDAGGRPLMFPARSRGLWVLQGNWLRRWADGAWAEDRGQHDFREMIPGLALEISTGDVIVPTLNNGLRIINRDGIERRPENRNTLALGSVSCLCEDREGNVWIGSGNGGLNVMRPQAIATVEPPDHWLNQPVITVTPTSQGGLFIGAEGGLVYHFENGLFASLSRLQSDSHLAIRSLYEDDRNTLWIGTGGGAGLWRESLGDLQPATATNFFPAQVNSIFETRSNGLWFGTHEGPVQLKDHRWNFLFQRFSLPHPDTRCFAEGPDGSVWFGTQGGGIGRFHEGRLDQFGQDQGLAGDYVWSLLAQADGTLWVGTYGSGLCRFKAGKFATVSGKNGLPSDVICSIIDDHDGNFWISSYGGVFRVNQAALNRCADGASRLVECLTFGFSDGLPTLEFSGGNQPAACRTADGKLWYPTAKGLVMVDPNAIRNNVLAPPVAINDLLVDGESVLAAADAPTGPIHISPGYRNIEFRYVGLSLAAPDQVHFKYRLEGLQPEWVEAGNRRSADYTLIPPGAYTFRVLACNHGGLWNEAGASLSLVVHPYFWQTWWFLAGGGLLVLAGVAFAASAVSHRRERRRREEVERQRASEQERTRIARDIHDQLGIGLTRISMLALSPAAATLPPNQNLTEIYQTTTELTRAMDEIVWAVNPRHDSLDSLLAYLGGYARKFLETAGLSCRLRLPMEVPRVPVSAEVRHHVFLAFQEVLNNVVKHAAATQVCIAAELAPAQLRLSITDDGRGFTAGAAAAGTPRNGLANIEHRLAAIGGRFTCASRPGSGTTIELLLPIQA